MESKAAHRRAMAYTKWKYARTLIGSLIREEKVGAGTWMATTKRWVQRYTASGGLAHVPVNQRAAEIVNYLTTRVRRRRPTKAREFAETYKLRAGTLLAELEMENPGLQMRSDALARIRLNAPFLSPRLGNALCSPNIRHMCVCAVSEPGLSTVSTLSK